ncbi:hypothetical protein GCM10027280_22760 [Micromonospora polyrhachis]|uniref:Mrp family chromosome partitioning ATPase n=1 Tax=Micromonospora polyrhachis TaxID=1282883 RepID=A0A7W7SX32_9ACTN|nr:hypothetical protein [Micromonospora polyrhachis]MBB4962590.1 Mrp family chromosome partitioning ATPase [Micromonospora polyrhachis]
MKRWFPDPGDIAAERAAAERLRQLPATPRVVAVCSGAGGVGVTTVGTGIAATLGTLWPDRVAYVGLAATPSLSGVHVVTAPLWTDQVDLAEVTRLTERFTVLLLDIGAYADPTARALLGLADRLLIVTDQAGRGVERVLARVAEAGPATRTTVIVGRDTENRDHLCLPHDKALRKLDAEILDRVRPATRRAYLTIAAWCL